MVGGGLTVEMVGTTDVVSWDDSDEGRSSVGGRGLYATKSVGLDCGGRAIAVTPCLYTGVDTGGVGSPELDIGICHRLATRNVDHVDVKMGDGTLLASEDVRPNELARYPWRMLVIFLLEAMYFCLQYGPSPTSGSSVQAAFAP